MNATRHDINGACARLIESVPYAVWLDIRVEPAGDASVFRLPFADTLIGNRHLPALHGGVVASFLELAMQFEVLISQQQQRAPHPVDFAIDYWRSARPRDLWASCRLIRQGRRMAQAQAECWQDDANRPVAFARAGFLLQDVDAGNDGRNG